MLRTVIVWWDLSGSIQTVESLRRYLLDESVAAFAEVPGLRLKMWIADPDTNRCGAVLLWESADGAGQPLPSRAAGLIGYPPTQSHEFDVEATVEGIMRWPSSPCAASPSRPPVPGFMILVNMRQSDTR